MCVIPPSSPPRQELTFLEYKNLRNVSQWQKIRTTWSVLSLSFLPRHIEYGKILVVWFWHIPVLLVAGSEMVKVWTAHFKVWNTSTHDSIHCRWNFTLCRSPASIHVLPHNVQVQEEGGVYGMLAPLGLTHKGWMNSYWIFKSYRVDPLFTNLKNFSGEERW